MTDKDATYHAEPFEIDNRLQLAVVPKHHHDETLVPMTPVESLEAAGVSIAGPTSSWNAAGTYECPQCRSRVTIQIGLAVTNELRVAGADHVSWRHAGQPPSTVEDRRNPKS